MPTIRLVPSTYYLSNSSYLSVSNADRMYHNTDNTTYATVTNSRTSTSSYYIYLRGFNFSDVPDAAVVSDINIKLKAYHSGGNTSTIYCYDGTTQVSACGSTTALTTSATVKTFTNTTINWDTLKGYGSDFGIRINCRRSSKNTTSHIYIYGAEIEVVYTVPNPRTITTSLNGNGTISPSGSNTYYDGDEFELTITPTNKSDTVTATQDGVDITSRLIAHGTETSASCVLGTYSLISGGFNGSGASYFQGIVGHGVDATKTTSNYYSSSSSTHAVFHYAMGFSLPSNANITRVWCEVNGHAESTSQSSEYMCVQLKSGNTYLSEQVNFKEIGTSNTTITLEAETLPTVSQSADMVLECTLGYYGGAINGATCYVEYDIGGGTVDHYTYTFVVSANSTIAVVIGTAETDKLFVKLNGSWVEVAKAYKKVNGSWVEQTDITSVFSAGTNYRRGSS